MTHLAMFFSIYMSVVSEHTCHCYITHLQKIELFEQKYIFKKYYITFSLIYISCQKYQFKYFKNQILICFF